MKEFIYENKHSLTPELCDHIIYLFNNSKEHQYIGRCGPGKIKLETKITTDLEITRCVNPDFHLHSQWLEVKNTLVNELKKNLSQYYFDLDPDKSIFNFDVIHNIKTFSSFLIHKYDKNKGKFTYHNDRYIDRKTNRYRILNYLWYLNDIDEGGETEFFGCYTLKPEKGKLVLFPSEWFFPHTGKIPISDDKYVIAGWIYVNI
jgi:hypothetical protein